MIPDPTPSMLMAAGATELVRRAQLLLERRVADLERAGDRVRHARHRLMLLCELAERWSLRAARELHREDEVISKLERVALPVTD